MVHIICLFIWPIFWRRTSRFRKNYKISFLHMGFANCYHCIYHPLN